MLQEVDWEREFKKDSLYALERQKDIEASWQEAENNKPITFIYENIPRNKSFRRFTKKVLLFRSYLPIEDAGTEAGYFKSLRGEYEDISFAPRSVEEGIDYGRG